MTFAEVEELVGQLPRSARDHRAWWANGTHTEAQAWMAAGWRVRSVNMAAMEVIFARGIAGQTPQRKPSAPGGPPAYVDAQVVARISAKAADKPQLDCTKLLRLISELNDNYSQGNGFGAHTLLRAILDHIPPMFGCKNFAAVVSNYRWSQTDKAYMRKLHDFRLQADDVLHRSISPTPDLLSLDDMPPRAWVNRLPQESASQPAPLIDQTRSAHAAGQRPMPTQPHSAPPTVREARKRLPSEGPRSAPWTVSEVLEAVALAGDDQAEVARTICDWATAHPHIRITGGTGGIDRAIMMSANTGQRGSRSPVVLYLVVYGRLGGGHPKLEIRVNEMCGTPPYNREELQARLTSELHAIGIPRLDAQYFFKRPNIPLADLTSGRVQRLLSVVDRWIKDTRAHAGDPAKRY